LSAREKIVAWMESQVGDRYHLGSHGPNDWDCSNLTSAAYASVGVRISPGSQQQWREVMDRRIPQSQIQPGDLVYWGTPGNAAHAGIYVGNGMVVNALNEQRGVVRDLHIAAIDDTTITLER
jgi:cell wall-associated NlpC family hydrolase